MELPASVARNQAPSLFSPSEQSFQLRSKLAPPRPPALNLNFMSHSHSTLEPPRRLLFGPGPTQVHPRVYEAMGKPIVGHLDPFFFEVYEEIRRDLRPVFGTQNTFVQVISGTGSAGMETELANFVEPGQKLAVFTAGYFSERFVEMGRRHGANVVCS